MPLPPLVRQALAIRDKLDHHEDIAHRCRYDLSVILAQMNEAEATQYARLTKAHYDNLARQEYGNPNIPNYDESKRRLRLVQGGSA